MLRLTVLLAFVANLNYVLLTALVPIPVSSLAGGNCNAKSCSGKYEEYAECPNRVCREKTCSEVGFPLSCYQTADLEKIACGKPQCICKQGYVKNKHGKCIPVRDCPSCGGDRNARSGCGTYCERCSNYKAKTIPCILLCRLNSCDCRPGYVYDEINKKCVEPEQCPCGPNEVRSDCANTPCVREYCSRKDLKIDCNCKPDRASCKPGCLCAKGYLRNDNGICVRENQCPTKCPHLEVPSDCVNGGCDKRNCSQLAQPPVCIDPAPGACIAGCVCQPGYLRTDAGHCVLQAKCPINEVCPNPNEYLDKCATNCPDPECGIGVIPTLVACSRPSNPADCVARCRCKDGYYRNADYKCIKKEECPPKCGPNEVPSDCGNNGCLPTCAEPERLTYCSYNPELCEPGCVCAEGYLRDEKGVCVPKDKCPPAKCPHLEVPSDCVNGGCDKRNCSQLAQPPVCIDPVPGACIAGCVCQPGYLRTDAGHCVLQAKCPSKEVCPKKNEYYDLCPPTCPGRKCGTNDALVLCPKPSPTDKCNEPACRCEAGFYRAPSGECVTFEECPPICGKNEVATDCGNNPCTPDCANPDNNLYCKFDLKNCKPGCACAHGFLRDENGVCIPKDKCKPLCGDNEYYCDCPNKVCIPKRCDELGFPLACANTDKNNTECGKPTCLCKSGLVRNKDGVCVKPSECPSCGGDENAEQGCGTHCIRCSNYKDKNRVCGLGCIFNGCKCRDKYIWDDIAQKCVLPENCLPQCGPNEISSHCGNNGCLPTCAKPDLDTLCRPDLTTCKPGCVCVDGFLRNEKGVCVPKDQCPPKQNVCLLPPEKGLCDALIPKFYYDSCKKDCLKFNYGGCGGNGNRFDTKEECLKKCSCNKN